MIYVNGVALDSTGWWLLDGSIPRMSVSMEHTKSRQAGRDGVTLDGGVHGSGEFRFKMHVERAARTALFGVFRAPVLVVTDSALPGWSATGALAGSSMDSEYGFLGYDEEMFVVEIPGGCWRGDEVTTSLTAASALGAHLSVFSGLSAPVQDAIVRIKGPLEDPQVLDTSGAFVVLDGTIPTGEYLRFESDTGRAWLTDTDTWAGGDEVSGLIDFGGPRDVFEITPRFPTPTDPTIREGRLTLSQASYNTGAGIQVRGRPAFLL